MGSVPFFVVFRVTGCNHLCREDDSCAAPYSCSPELGCIRERACRACEWMLFAEDTVQLCPQELPTESPAR